MGLFWDVLWGNLPQLLWVLHTWALLTAPSDEPQTCGLEECGPGEGACTAATLTQLHSFHTGKKNSMETGRFNGVGSVAFLFYRICLKTNQASRPD